MLEDSRLVQLAGNAALVAEFSMLGGVRRAAEALKGCARCQTAAKRAALVEALNAAKAAIAGMPADRKRRLASALSARRVRVVYRDGPKTIELTFGS